MMDVRKLIVLTLINSFMWKTFILRESSFLFSVSDVFIFLGFQKLIFYFCQCTVYCTVYDRLFMISPIGTWMCICSISIDFMLRYLGVLHRYWCMCVSVYYIVLSVVLAQYTLTPLDCFCWVMFVQCIHLQQSKSRPSVLLFSFYYPSPSFFLPFLIWCFSVQLEMWGLTLPSPCFFSHMC